MLSPEGLVRVEDCMNIIFRRTGPPSDRDLGRLFGYGYLGNLDAHLPLNRFLLAVHKARAGISRWA